MQRRKQKARHKAAKEGMAPEPKRKPQQVEQHFDDCGEDFSLLDVGLVEPDSECDDDSEDDDRQSMFDTYFGMNGCDYEFEQLADNSVKHHPGTYREFDSIDAFLADSLDSTKAAYDDVAQPCGGAGDTAALLVRRGYVEGPNYDLVVGIDLLRPDSVRQVEHYVTVHKPRIMLLSTPCTGMKGFASLNASINPEAHARSLAVSMPLARLSARVAMAQMNDGRHFVAEHPQGSALWFLQAWRKVADYPQVVRVLMHQCMAGLVGPRSGNPVKKPTEFWASDPRLLRRLKPLQCDGNHVHAQLDGRTPGIPCDKAKDVARWPRGLRRRLADGCEQVLSEDFGRRRAGGGQSPALPLLTPRSKTSKPGMQISPDSEEREHECTLVAAMPQCTGYPASTYRNCRGCVNNRILTDPEHRKDPNMSSR
jgi:hypothetical protein